MYLGSSDRYGPSNYDNDKLNLIICTYMYMYMYVHI